MRFRTINNIISNVGFVCYSLHCLGLHLPHNFKRLISPRLNGPRYSIFLSLLAELIETVRYIHSLELYFMFLRNVPSYFYMDETQTNVLLICVRLCNVCVCVFNAWNGGQMNNEEKSEPFTSYMCCFGGQGYLWHKQPCGLVDVYTYMAHVFLQFFFLVRVCSDVTTEGLFLPMQCAGNQTKLNVRYQWKRL